MICSKCGDDTDDFYASTLKIGSKACRKCVRAYGQAYRAKRMVADPLYRNQEYLRTKGKTTPEQQRKADLKCKYGLTMEDYNHFLEVQNGCCGICQCELIKPYVDHNHVTGKVRGLLCQKCNSGIGLLGDDLENMKRAVDWLS